MAILLGAIARSEVTPPLPMKIAVEILHPAHVHVFRNAIADWLARGDEVRIFSRDKECANALLEYYGLRYSSISALRRGKLRLLSEMAVRDWRMWRACRSFGPDVLVGVMGVTIVQVARLIGRPAVVFYDTENATLTNRIVYPLATAVCTPSCYKGPVRGRHVTYRGYHELAYLHPNRFKPDPEVPRQAGLRPDEPYFVVRFVSWQASHDIGEGGLCPAFQRRLVRALQAFGRVLITSEGPLPEDLEPLRFSLHPALMHHVLARAALLVGESATMASEAAVLGVPALFISDTGRGYTDEQQRRYGLVFNFKRDQTRDIERTLDALLRMPGRRQVFAANRERLLRDKIDTTAWMVDFIDRHVAPRKP